MRPTLGSLTLMAALGLGASQAAARSTCEFVGSGATQTLLADCETDETLSIPAGVTWDGAGHRIVAVDPPGGHFTGAVVRNAGEVAHVRNLTIEARGLAGVCDTEDARLRGILFEAASGTIRSTRVLNVRQGDRNGCQEGNAIEARNPPYDGSRSQTRRVVIRGNHVEGYQKTGIVVNGDVSAEVADNRVIGLGPIDFIAQNGIQIGYGATAVVRSNRVEGNSYVLDAWGSAGILLLHAGEGVEVRANYVRDSDVGIWLSATSSARVTLNHVRASVREAVLIEGVEGEALANDVTANWLEQSRIGVTIHTPDAADNVIAHNLMLEQTLAGIQVLDAEQNVLRHNKLSGPTEYGVWLRGDGNEVTGNWIRTAGVGMRIEGTGNELRWNVVHGADLDIDDEGDNHYHSNHCHDASGESVDCP